ncbi:LysR family transcriptional regulator [Sagittula sp. S175]|uniref:LysR family transcriptional regulator n=1 Tax=Sagittula sp. S175 TaxID=3415129 RepID=UPI003C7C65A9
MQPDWTDLRTVLALVRGGTLAAAGDALGVTYTTVARRVARLEEALGETLFERLTDGYRPTATARLVAERAAEMEASEHALMRSIAGQDARLSGRFVVTAPQLVIAHVLAPSLKRFAEAHPAVELHIRATNDLLDLSRREADLGIRVSRSPGDTLKGLRLAAQDTACFGSETVAERIAVDPEGPVDWILHSGTAEVPKAAMAQAPGSRVRFRFDDMIAIAAAVQAGLGVARMPMFLGRALPGVVQVPILPPTPYADIWVVGHPDVWSSAKSVAFREVIAADVKAQRTRFVA